MQLLSVEFFTKNKIGTVRVCEKYRYLILAKKIICFRSRKQLDISGIWYLYLPNIRHNQNSVQPQLYCKPPTPPPSLQDTNKQGPIVFCSEYLAHILVWYIFICYDPGIFMFQGWTRSLLTVFVVVLPIHLPNAVRYLLRQISVLKILLAESFFSCVRPKRCGSAAVFSNCRLNAVPFCRAQTRKGDKYLFTIVLMFVIKKIKVILILKIRLRIFNFQIFILRVFSSCSTCDVTFSNKIFRVKKV